MKNFKNSNSKSYILTLLKKSLYNTHPVPSYQILISILVSEKKSHYSTISIFHITYALMNMFVIAYLFFEKVPT